MRKAYKAHHVITPTGGRKAARKPRPKSSIARMRVECRPDALAMLQALPLRGVEKAVAKAKRGRR